MTPGGTSRSTTAPAPTTLPRPTRTPWTIGRARADPHVVLEDDRPADPGTRPDGDELADLDVVAQGRPDVEVAVPSEPDVRGEGDRRPDGDPRRQVDVDAEGCGRVHHGRGPPSEGIRPAYDVAPRAGMPQARQVVDLAGAAHPVERPEQGRRRGRATSSSDGCPSSKTPPTVTPAAAQDAHELAPVPTGADHDRAR